MPDASWPRVEAGSPPLAPALPLSAWSRGLMVAFGFIPSLHALAVLGLVAAAAGGWAGRSALGLAVAVLYLLPPLAARVAAFVWPLPEGVVAIGSRGFLAWWLAAQWQMVFSRLRFLEEALRLLPGVYSAWLRCWGARVGRLVYWTPGVEISDRGLLEVGDRVVFGAGVRVSAHVISGDAGGRMALAVAPVRIGAGALVGAHSLLMPGVRIAAGEVSPPLRLLRPFSEWAGGRERRHAAPVPEAGS